MPGGGTYGMEAVARQFGRGAKVLVVRNGWFSYRWSQIFEAGWLHLRETTVLKARQTGNAARRPLRPPRSRRWWPRSAKQKPDVVFAPHVETSGRA